MGEARRGRTGEGAIVLDHVVRAHVREVERALAVVAPEETRGLRREQDGHRARDVVRPRKPLRDVREAHVAAVARDDACARRAPSVGELTRDAIVPVGDAPWFAMVFSAGHGERLSFRPGAMYLYFPSSFGGEWKNWLRKALRLHINQRKFVQ